MKTCGFFSHTATRFRFGWDEEDELCLALKQLMLQQFQLLRRAGFQGFSVVPDSGAGLWAGELLQGLADQGLTLRCILPHEETATKWSPSLRDRYFSLLETCGYVDTISRPGDKDAMRKALVQMMSQCDFLLGIYDPDSRRGDPVDQAFLYLKNSGKPYVLIHPDTLELKQWTGNSQFPV